MLRNLTYAYVWWEQNSKAEFSFYMECYKSLIFDCYEKFSHVKINNYRKSPNPLSKTGLNFYRILDVFFAYTEIFAEAIVILNFNILFLHLAHVAHSFDDRFAQLSHYLL